MSRRVGTGTSACILARHPQTMAEGIPSETGAYPAQIADVDVFTSASPRCFDRGDVDLLHRHHRFECTLRLTTTSRKRIGQRARGDLPGQTPAVFAPTPLAFRAAIANDRVPVTVGLFLSVRRDLEGKGFRVPERRSAIEAKTRNTNDSELHRQHIAFFAARIIAGSLVNSGYFTIGKSGRVEARRVMCVFIEPEADGVLWLHVRVLLVFGQRERRVLRSARSRFLSGIVTQTGVAFIHHARIVGFSEASAIDWLAALKSELIRFE